MTQRLNQAVAVHHTDTIEVVNEVDRLIYLFTGSAGVTAEQFVDNWASTGAQTWTAQRDTVAEDLIDLGYDDLARHAHRTLNASPVTTTRDSRAFPPAHRGR